MIDGQEVADPALAVDDVGFPAELLDGLKHAPCEEDRPFVVVLEFFAFSVPVDEFAMEVVFVVDEVDLHPGGRDGRDFDDQRAVGVVDDEVHPRQADDFVQLIPSFVDRSIPGHERPDFLAALLNPLGKESSRYSYVCFRHIGEDLGAHEQDSYRFFHL